MSTFAECHTAVQQQDEADEAREGLNGAVFAAYLGVIPTSAGPTHVLSIRVTETLEPVERMPLGPDTPVHQAAIAGDAAALEALLEDGTFGWALNVRDASGQAPIHWAVLGGYVRCVEVLLGYGADPNVVDANGVPPLWTAEDDFGMHALAELLKAAGATK